MRRQTLYSHSLSSYSATREVSRLILILLFVLSTFLVFNVRAQTVLVWTGFEEFDIGDPPEGWEVNDGQFEVTDEVVKTESKSLGVFGGADGDALGVPLLTEKSIISVEFWVYIKSGGRSLNLKITSAENIATNEGGTYINWNGGRVRSYDGVAWVDIGEFETDKWKYFRVVVDSQESVFDFYSGNTREEALKAKPVKNLKFRNAAFVPVCRWIVFYIWAVTAPGYFDDLLAYEGEEALLSIGAIEPTGKLSSAWGWLKNF